MKASHRKLSIEKLLIDAEHLLRAAQQNAGLWADDIRQGAERRLNCDPTDDCALDDPLYDRALGLCSRLTELADGTAEALAEQRHITKANKEA